MRQSEYVGAGSIQWHGVQADKPDWSETSRLVAFTLSSSNGGLYVAFNSGHLPTTVQFPDWPGRQWRLLIDTSKARSTDTRFTLLLIILFLICTLLCARMQMDIQGKVKKNTENGGQELNLRGYLELNVWQI